MYKISFFLFFCFFSISSFGQHILRGKVQHASTKEAIVGASVYINNSSIGTSTTKDGSYSLRVPSTGNYEVVVVALGYQSESQRMESDSRKELNFLLHAKVQDIEAVEIAPYLKDGWKEWGQYFTETFIGRSRFAKNTKLLNPEVLQFRYSKNKQLLTVKASEPLRINNKDLGYMISYDLSAYKMDFKNQYLFFEGTVFMQSNAKVSNKILQHRKEVYASSLLRFLRSIYADNVVSEGYDIRVLKRVVNNQKVRADSVLQPIRQEVHTLYQGNWNAYYTANRTVPRDSINQWMAWSAEPKTYSILGDKIPISSLLVVPSDIPGTVALKYTDFLYVANDAINFEPQYFSGLGHQLSASLLSMPEGASIYVDQLGNYYPAQNWVLEGYWGWYSKVATMLPFDYGL